MLSLISISQKRLVNCNSLTRTSTTIKFNAWEQKFLSAPIIAKIEAIEKNLFHFWVHTDKTHKKSTLHTIVASLVGKPVKHRTDLSLAGHEQ